MQTFHRRFEFTGDRVLAAIEPGSDSDRDAGDHDAGDSHRCIEVDNVLSVITADELTEWDETGNTGNSRQNNQRGCHGSGSLMRFVFMFCRITPEDTEVEAEHIECGQRSDECHDPTHHRAEFKSCGEDLILTEESRERRDTCDSEAGDQEGDVCNRHLFAESAHMAHFVAVDGVDNCTGPQEEQRLEHSVSKEVEHAGHITEAVVSAVT